MQHLGTATRKNLSVDSVLMPVLQARPSRPKNLLRLVKSEELHAVYVVGCESHPDVCKIGIADDPIQRFSAIQVGNWIELRLHQHWWTQGREISARIEAAILDTFAPDRVRGEWIGLPPKQVASAVEHTAELNKFKLWREDELAKIADDMYERQTVAMMSLIARRMRRAS